MPCRRYSHLSGKSELTLRVDASIPFQGGEREETYMKLWDIGFDCFSTDYPSVMFGAIGKLKQRGLQVQDK